MRSILPYLPTRRDFPTAFHSAAAAVPDLVVQVHRRAHMARHHPEFLPNTRLSIDFHVAVFLIHLAHGPGASDKMAERSGTDRLIARERLGPGVDHALARHRGADDCGEHAQRTVGLDTALRCQAARVIEDVSTWPDLGRL